jgi:hypothetical protein
LAEVAALRARVVELEAQQLGIASKAAGPRPSAAAAYRPYLEAEPPIGSDLGQYTAAASSQAPSGHKAAPLASTPKARAKPMPIGAKPPSAKQDVQSKEKDKVEKGKVQKVQEKKKPPKLQKPPPIGGRPPARGRSRGRSRTRSYSGSYYSDSDYSSAGGQGTRAAPIGAKAKPASSKPDRASKGKQRSQRRVSPRTPPRSPARARVSGKRQPVQLVSAAVVAAGTRKADDDTHAASHRHHHKNKGVKARLHRLLLQRAETNRTSLAEEKAMALAEASRQGISLQELLEGRLTSRGECGKRQNQVGTTSASSSTAAPASGGIKKEDEKEEAKDTRVKAEESDGEGGMGADFDRTSSPSPAGDVPEAGQAPRAAGSAKEAGKAGGKSKGKGKGKGKKKGKDGSTVRDASVQVAPEVVKYTEEFEIGPQAETWRTTTVARPPKSPAHLYSVQAAVYGPGRSTPSASAQFKLDFEGDTVVLSSYGWIMAPRVGREYRYTTLFGLPLSIPNGQELRHTGKLLVAELRHKEEKKDSLGFCNLLWLVAVLGVPASRLLGTVLFNFDQEHSTFRFELAVEEPVADGTALTAEQRAARTGTGHLLSVRATRKHSFAVLA